MNGALEALERRLRRTDLAQVAALSFLVLGFVLVTRWPALPGAANESWFALTQVRLALAALLGLGFGSAESGAAARGKLASVAALTVLTLCASPFDAAAHAGSAPATPLGWSMMLAPLETVAFYGLGVLLGEACAALRLRSLLPLLVPALLVALVLLDVRLGLTLLNPLTAGLRPAPAHGALVLGGAAATLAALAWRARRAPPREDPW